MYRIYEIKDGFVLTDVFTFKLYHTFDLTYTFMHIGVTFVCVCVNLNCHQTHTMLVLVNTGSRCLPKCFSYLFKGP